jgi:hypothetical protein
VIHCRLCLDNPTAGPPGERCALCGAVFAEPPSDDESRYNGWRNRETWLVALWVNNERETQSLAESTADEDELREMVEAWAAGYAEQAPAGHPFGLFVDLVTGALGCVDWRELYEHWHPAREGADS